MERNYAEAVALADELLAQYDTHPTVYRAARATFSKSGATSRHLRAIESERRFRDNPWLREQEARLRGRLLETSADWRPEVEGEPEQVTPTSSHRILHIVKVAAPYRQSGYTMRSKYLLAGQKAIGLDPVVVGYLGFPKSVGVQDAPATEVIDGVRHVWLDADNHEDHQPHDQVLQDFVAAAAPHVRELAPAVIHAHSGFRGFDTALVALALGRHFDLPVVYEVRGFFESMWTSDHEWSERSETYERRLATETRCMNDADAVVTLSESMKAEIVGRGVPAQKVHVVPNGVNLDVFRPRKRSAELVERYGLSGSFTFGYVSNLDHHREGQETLIDAAVSLRRRGVSATAVIVGDGARRDKLEQHAKERNAGNAVVFTGQVPHDQVLDYYALLDVFVVPRIAERAARLVTPLKPFEAMAVGVPIVTSDLPVLREVTGDGERGRYFAAGDGEALADVLADLQADPASRAELAERAREWVVAERQWSTNGKRYAEIYRDLLSSRNSLADS